MAYKNNARTHSRRQIAHMAGSIKRFGFLNPVVIDGSNQIIKALELDRADQSFDIPVLPRRSRRCRSVANASTRRN